jgi:hypothetical protein
MESGQAQPPTIARKVYRMHIGLVRKVNDTHIFTAQARRVLMDAQEGSLSVTRKGKDKRYDVPSVRKGKFARRKPQEVKQIYRRFMDHELYENFIVSAISQLESFLFETLRLVLIAYPHKLKINVKGLEIDRSVPLDSLLGKDDLQAVLEEIIESRIVSISYANPKTYLQFVGKLAGIDVEDTAFEEYLEIKATRDLLIHNAGIANALYLSKAGGKGRAAIGARVDLDQRYFDHCIATIKRISGIVSRDIGKAFPDRLKSEAGPVAAVLETLDKAKRDDQE